MVHRTIKYYGAPHHKPAKPVLRTMNPDPHPRHAWAWQWAVWLQCGALGARRLVGALSYCNLATSGSDVVLAWRSNQMTVGDDVAHAWTKGCNGSKGCDLSRRS